MRDLLTETVFNLLHLAGICFFMRVDPTFANTPHLNTLAECGSINYDWVPQFVEVVIGFMLVLFCSFVTA